MYLDTRDLYKQQQELQEELDNLQETVTDAEELLAELMADRECRLVNTEIDAEEALITARTDLKEWEDENAEELEELDTLETEVGSEWMHGEILIPEDEFEDYARDPATNTGTVSVNNRWPLNHIDWDAAAEELRVDYSEADYQNVTYYFRMS